MEIILASSSPRRRELLSKMGLDFTIKPSNFDEILDENRDPKTVAEELALGKAQDIANDYPDALIIGADTLVWLNGKQLGKPNSADEAKEMLKHLSGQSTFVTTSVAIINISSGIKMVDSDTTMVHFKPYSKEAVARYVATGDYADKAGGYGIQSGAAPLISHIKGNYDTIVGLPTKLLAKLLNDIGVTANSVELKTSVPEIF